MSSTYFSDTEADLLIQASRIKTSTVTDESGSTDNTLENGGRLIHHRDLSKPLGWEYFAPAAVDPAVAADEAAHAAADTSAAEAELAAQPPLDPAVP